MSGHEVSRLSLAVNERDHAQGDEQAMVTLVEYGDYQCPHCGMAYPVVKEVQRRLGSRLRFVFRNFPLTEIHPQAQQAAEAAEAAGAQGAFWEMHDALFENQRALDDWQIVHYARALGLNHSRLHSDLISHAYADRVRSDFVSGVKSGVNGTPTFFINGARHDGPWNVEALTEALLAATMVEAR